MSANRDSVAELLIRREPSSSSSSESNASTIHSSRPRTALGQQLQQDHVGYILQNIPPTPADREAFGINSISHKKRISNPNPEPSQYTRQIAEQDRFFNGIADARAHRRDMQSLMSLRYDSSAVATSLMNDKDNLRNNRPTLTTFDIRDAIRTPSGLLLPEPSANHHRGHVVPAIDHLTSSENGIVPISKSLERDDLSIPTNKARLDRNRVIADQYGASVKEVFGSVSSNNYHDQSLIPGRPVPNHIHHSTNNPIQSHLYQGNGTAEALIRPVDFLPPANRSINHDNDDNQNNNFRTTYREEHTGHMVGEPKTSPQKRRYYGGSHDGGRNDPYKKTQIY